MVDPDRDGQPDDPNSFFPVALSTANFRLPDSALVAVPPAFMTDSAAIAGFLSAHPHVHAIHNGGAVQTPAAAPDGHDLEDDDGASDASSGGDVVELENEDFPHYFDERAGRLFHSHGIQSSYTFPVDGIEWKVRWLYLLRSNAWYTDG